MIKLDCLTVMVLGTNEIMDGKMLGKLKDCRKGGVTVCTAGSSDTS